MIISIFQKSLWVVCNPVFRVFLRFKVNGKENFKKINDGKVIIVANHKSILDPLFVGASIPFFSNIWPLRFMVAQGNFQTPLLNFFYNIGLLKLFYFIMGCFPAIKGQGLQKALEIPEKILKNNEGSIMIFPEGGKVLKEGLGKGRRGAAALAIKTGYPVLPMYIKNNLGIRPYNFWKKPVIIKVGEPFYVQDMGGSKDERFEKETEFLMERVKSLY